MATQYKHIDTHKTTNLTLGYTGTVAAEDVVTLTANEQVGRGAAEAQIFGQALVVESGRAKVSVKTEGYIEALYSGTAPTAGANKELVVDGAGKVKVPATAGTGTRVDILLVDTATTTVVFRLK